MKRLIGAMVVLACLGSACGDRAGGTGSAFAPPSGSLPGQAGKCELVPSGSWGPRGQTALKVEKAVTGLEVPWAIGFLPGGDYLVSERPGRVRLVQSGTLLQQPVLEVTTGESGEGGLLGLAVDPAFSTNHFFYIYYTTQDPSGVTTNRLERYRLSDDSAHAVLDRVLLQGIPAGVRHDGGRLRFGPDGALYLGTGDGTEPDRAQDPASLNGKILRIDPSNGAVSTYVTGVRNVEAFDWWDPSTLIVADHGPTGELGLTGRDEITVAHAGDNLGWPKISACESAPGLVTPFLSWTDALPPGGEVIYRGSLIPDFKGSILVTSLGAEHLHRIRPDGSHEMYLDAERGYGRLREIVTAPDGALLVTTSNCDGRGSCGAEKDMILRITQ